MTAPKIPPKSEWSSLTLAQLYDVKSKMFDIYYNARASGASYADQYLSLVNQLENEINTNMAKTEADREAMQKAAEEQLNKQAN